MEERVRVSDKDKKAVRDVMKETFRTTTSAEDEDTIMKNFQRYAQNTIYEIERLEVYYKDHRYPGKKVLATGKNLMLAVVQIQSAMDFFTTVSKKRDDFYDFAEDYEPIKAFFAGEQLTIFTRALDMLAIYDDSKTYIVNAELEDIVAQMRSIVGQDKPYASIPRLPELREKFMSCYVKFCKQESAPVLDSIDQARLRVLEVLSAKEYNEQKRSNYFALVPRDPRRRGTLQQCVLSPQLCRQGGCPKAPVAQRDGCVGQQAGAAAGSGRGSPEGGGSQSISGTPATDEVGCPCSSEDPQDQECFNQNDDRDFLLASGEQGGHRQVYRRSARNVGGTAGRGHDCECGVLRRSAMFRNTLRMLEQLNGTMTYKMDVLPDEDGYYDKECPNEKCLSKFKVNAEDWKNLFSDEAVFCPFCGHSAPSRSWWTTEQIEQAKEQAINQVSAKIGQALEADAREFNRSQPRKSFIKMSMKFSGRTSFINLPASALEEMEQKIQCEKCGARYAVVGSAFYCPCCGHNSAKLTFFNTIDKVKAKINNLDVVRKALEVVSKDEAARNLYLARGNFGSRSCCCISALV